jgi:phenylacetate-coenzyme A ligase PaaK-like adenylate-forming protein
MQQLSTLLHHACENVPYYRRVLEENGRKSKKRKESSKRINYPNTGKEIPE